KDPRGELTDSPDAATGAVTRTTGGSVGEAAGYTGGFTGGETFNEHARPIALDGYTVGEVIGRGGMGEVLLAHDEVIGREVAIKHMRRSDPDADAETRFLREAKIQARLQHPSIVPVHELGRDADGRLYFTMKRLAGV